MTRGDTLRVVKFCVFAVAFIGLLSPAGVGANTLSELLAKQAALKQQEEQNRRALEQKRAEANSLNSAISGLNSSINTTSSQISNTEAQIAVSNQVIQALNESIDSSNAELGDLNTKLSSAYVTLYELSQTSTIELILQSNSLDEIVSQTQYIQSIQTDLQSSIAKQNEIKADLESKKAQADEQKKSLEELKQRLDQDRSNLNSQRAQKNRLLTVTQGQQSHYEKLLEQIRSQSAVISREIFAARQAAGGFLQQGGTGGYPWANNCDKVDQWLYFTCQCTSYAAWKFLQIHGVPFNNTRPGQGSAYNWPALAGDQGYKVQVGGTPRVGDIVSWNRPLFAGDQWGHVAIVEQVFSATDVVISEYNWSPPKKFSVRRINPFTSGTPRYIFP